MGLSKEIILTVKDYEIKLNRDIKFYENDTIDLCFSILEYGIEVKDGVAVNKLMPINALKAYMLIETPQGVDYAESTKVENNRVVFNLGNKYSQFIGIGKMQIVIKDNDGCRITLPEFPFEIRESINSDWDRDITVLSTEGNEIIIDEFGRKIELKKISEMEEANILPIDSYSMILDNDGNKKIKTNLITRKIENDLQLVNSQLDNKANKTITDNIQGQVNNLVLGAVGDGNNAEVVQARGTKALLNDRLLDIESDIDISLKDYELINLVYDKTGVITTNKFINNAGNIASASNSIIRYITISNIKTGVPLYVGSIGQHPFKITTNHIGQIQIIDDSETVLAIVNAKENMPSSGVSATLNSIPEGATKLRFNLGYKGNDFKGKLYVGYRPFLEKYLYKSNSYTNKIQEEVDGLKIIKEEVENSRKTFQTLGERLDRNDTERNIIFKDYELNNLIFDLNRVTTYDKFVNGGGTIVVTKGARYIEVPITEGKTLYASGTGVNPFKITTLHIGQIQILDENKSVLLVLNQTTEGSAGNTASAVIPEGAKWLRVNTNFNGNEFVGKLYIGYNPPEDKYFLEENAYENSEINLIKSQSVLNPLYGKKIVAIGDSMVKGHTLSENDVWLTKLALRNGMSYKNYGINGCFLIAKPGLVAGEPGVIERYVNMDDDADYIVVFAGTNDAGGNVTLGTISSTDNTTFYGALNNLCKGLIAKYPTKKIMFITPFKRKASFLQYVNAIEEVCGNYGIAVFNNYKRGGIAFDIPEQASALTLGDNVHLNALGHEYSSYKYEAELKRL